MDVTFTDLMNTTLPKYSKNIFDNVTKNNALLAFMEKNGNVTRESGGAYLVETIEGAENGTFKWYSGFEVLDISPSNVLFQAVYGWKQASVNMVMSGLEERNNDDSESRIYNAVEAKIKNAEHTAKNNIAKALFSDGTGASGKEIGGLKLIISDNPATSTVGGISAAEHPFWMNQVYSIASDGGVSGSPKPQDIVNAYGEMMLRTTCDSDSPDIIVAGYKHYSLYKQYCQSIKTINTESYKIGEASFTALEYEGKPVVYDPSCDTNSSYFNNTKYLKLRVHKKADFTWQNKKTPVNQDATVWPLLFQGNMTCSNRNRQGVVIA